jgi:hypothetical protein
VEDAPAEPVLTENAATAALAANPSLNSAAIESMIAAPTMMHGNARPRLTATGPSTWKTLPLEETNGIDKCTWRASRPMTARRRRLQRCTGGRGGESRPTGAALLLPARTSCLIFHSGQSYLQEPPLRTPPPSPPEAPRAAPRSTSCAFQQHSARTLLSVCECDTAAALSLW